MSVIYKQRLEKILYWNQFFLGLDLETWFIPFREKLYARQRETVFLLNVWWSILSKHLYSHILRSFWTKPCIASTFYQHGSVIITSVKVFRFLSLLCFFSSIVIFFCKVFSKHFSRFQWHVQILFSKIL